ncbi:hypothetical protein [Novosphingobium aerophilum]|uniref:Uncharacterized protein n=1 Tax=Novosphingobium aerophilum TaxID=2839843 RepID=A0A7X1KD88_9SPHN|nr:hypothetical protein [Novosphingobium aerophilum]MBC2653089.1 hypothetical protein [Novosphingobium aerophilum]
MAQKPAARPIFDAPIQVIAGRDGTVALFLPDGHRVVLTAAAAQRSAAMLSRARPVLPPTGAARTGGPPTGPAGQVIAADFGGGRAPPPGQTLGKPDAGAYMAPHHGPTDPSHLRQEENRRRKSARAVRLPY